MTKTLITFSSEITVKLVDSMARDSTVIHAAKVSTLGDRADSLYVAPEDQSNAGLINYLMRDRHGSPFEHNAFTFFVKAPIFVFREFMRHRIASYNEESGRYSVLKPEFYIPGNGRNMVQEGKPGAYNYVPGFPSQVAATQAAHKVTSREAYERYDYLLKLGIAQEVARMSLPLNIYSSMYVTMNARALMNFLSLRVKSDISTYRSFPQREIEMAAEQMEAKFARLMPLTYDAFINHGRVAP